MVPGGADVHVKIILTNCADTYHTYHTYIH